MCVIIMMDAQQIKHLLNITQQGDQVRKIGDDSDEYNCSKYHI